MLRFCALAALLCLPAFAGEKPSIDDALQHLYSFNFPAAHRALNSYIGEHPEDPLPYAFRASAYLGILESEFLTDDEKIKDKKELDPDPAIRSRFMDALNNAQSRANALLKTNPNDRNALFAMSVAQGVATDYMALVEKRQFSSLSPAKRSNSYAQRLLKLDPKFYDAYLTAGFSEYMLGSLPFFIRWFVHFDNVSGSKEKGRQQLELVAREGRYFRAFAKILLGICDLREKRPADAQRLLAELAREYPSNPLFRTELAKLNSKLGMAAN
jgi:predicted Zn-dependent protease